MGKARVWFQAIRAFSFTASVIPVLAGTILGASGGPFHPFLFFLALFGALSIHIGTNLINDYYDHVKGVDTPTSLGPSLVIQRGLLPPGQVYWGGILAFVMGSLLGLILVAFCGWPLLVIGITSVLTGYFYTANPLSLAYIALGEITVFICMGPLIVLGAYFVQRQTMALEPFLLSLPIGCLVTAILHANNLRDIDSDRQKGKKTLANVLGRQAARVELLVLIASAFFGLFVLALFDYAPWPALTAFLSLRHALKAVRIAWTTEEPRLLNVALLGTVRLHLEFGLLLVLGLLLHQMLPKWLP